jgi:hypothetical protein
LHTFTHNYVSHLYCIIVFILIVAIFGRADEVNNVSATYAIFYAVLAGSPAILFLVKNLSEKLVIDKNRIVRTDLFSKDSVLINKYSLIYTKRNFQSFNVIIRRYDYQIKIINGNEVVKINANMNNADALFELVRDMESEYILPYWIESFNRMQMLKFDEKLMLEKNGIRYNNKLYNYSSLSSITIQNGSVYLKKEGALWQSAVLTIPCANIPNLQTFLTIVHQTSGLL